MFGEGAFCRWKKEDGEAVESEISVKAKFAGGKVDGCAKFLFWKTFRVCKIFIILTNRYLYEILENFSILFRKVAFLRNIFSIALSYQKKEGYSVTYNA